MSPAIVTKGRFRARLTSLADITCRHHLREWAYRVRVVRYRVLISGRVQGVFFRDTCRAMAVRHGVSGWVRNVPDGSVEAVFEGPAAEVSRLVDWSRHGPRSAVVENVRVEAEPPEGISGFRIRH